MKTLVLYDLTGKVYNTIVGASEEDKPDGIPHLWIESRDDVMLERVDVSDLENPKPIYSYPPDSEFGKLPDDVTKLQEELKATKQELLDTKLLFDETIAELTIVMTGMNGGAMDV